MANDLNKIVIIGRLTRDVELRYTPSGVSVASFSIANNKSYTKNNENINQVSYFECVAWDKLAEIINKYCQKGSLVCIDGRLQQRSWEDKDDNKRYKVEILVENLQFLGKKASNENENNLEENRTIEQIESEFGDIPF